MKTDHLVEKNEMIKNHIVDMHEMVVGYELSPSELSGISG